MSVARALQNFDILCAICEELAPEHYLRRYRRRRRRSELACLARVCSAFSDPATRVLWRVLLGVGPVLGLLPSVAVTEDARGYPRTKHYTLAYSDTVDGWQSKFEQYTRHVRVIDYTDSYGAEPGYYLRPCHDWSLHTEHIDPVLEQFLLISFRNTPLLPFLQRLTWKTAGYRSQGLQAELVLPPPLPLSLLHSPVRQLTLRLSTPGEGRFHSPEGILSAISFLVPSLEELTLYEQRITIPNWHPAPIPMSIYMPRGGLQAIAACAHLQRLSIFGDHVILDHHQLSLMLSASPQLRHLRIVASRIDASSIGTVQRLGRAPAASALETLQLTIPGEDFTRFFELVQTSRLRMLSLRPRNQDMVIGHSAIWLGQVAVNRWSTTIRVVRLWFDAPQFPEQWIRPLVAISGLEQLEVCIRRGRTPVIDDDALLISRSWPRLTKFLLLYGREPRLACSLSHRSLQHFADNCQDLEQLVLPGIYDPDVDHHAHLPRPRPHNKLKTLLFGPHLDVRCMQCFARYTHTMFPNIRAHGRPADHVRFPYHKHHSREFWKALSAD